MGHFGKPGEERNTGCERRIALSLYVHTVLIPFGTDGPCDDGLSRIRRPEVHGIRAPQSQGIAREISGSQY